MGRRTLLLVVGLLASVGAACSFGALDGFAGGEPPQEDAGDAGSPPSGDADSAPSGDAGTADPLTAALVGHWTFDEGTGVTAQDSSGRGNHAVLRGAPTWTTGKHGGAIHLDGVKQFVEVLSLWDAKFPTDGTLSLWLKGSFTESGNRPIFDGYDLSRSHFALRQHDLPRRLQFLGQIADAGTVFSPSFDVPSDTWVHVVLVWDSTNHRIAAYLDGALVYENDAIASGWAPRDQEVAFGRPSSAGGHVGELDDIRLYDRPLTAAEITLIP
jgi:hypothetical protein